MEKGKESNFPLFIVWLLDRPKQFEDFPTHTANKLIVCKAKQN